MKRKFSYTIILWIGAASWLVSAFTRIVLSFCGYEITGQDVLIDTLGLEKNTLYVGVMLIAAGCVAPIMEEFLFRYWIKSKNRVITLVLFTVMSGYVAFNTFWWLGAVGFIFCMLLGYFLRKRSNFRTIFLMFSTSLLFSVAHITGFSQFSLDMVLCMTELFGLGLVLCWLVYNVGFWWSCLLHVVNNIIAILIVMLTAASSSAAPSPVNFDTTLYSVSLQPISEECIDFREVNDSTVVVKGNLPVIAFNLVQRFNPDIIQGSYSSTEFFKIKLTRKKKTCWECSIIFHDTIPYRHAPFLVADLAQRSNLKIDTTYENMYVLGIEDVSKVNRIDENTNKNLAELVEDIRIKYDCPMVLEKGTNEYYPVYYEQDIFSYPYEMDMLIPILSERLGLFVYKSDVHKIQVVTFSDLPK